MTTLVEGNLRITLPRGARARKFDDSTHGLLHRHMKAVDFVIEMNDRMLYLEVKDPEHPKARTEQSEAFIAQFLATDMDDDLVRKFRDSLLYEWACDEIRKPIHYWVIVAIERLGAPELSSRSDDLKRKLPVAEVTPARWRRRMVEDCRVFNIRTWNEALPEGYSVQRIDV